MYKTLFIILPLFLLLSVSTFAQEKTKTFTSKLISQEITYNASPNPNECWEAVQWGIKIPQGKTFYFFTMNYKEVEKAKTKVGDNEVQIEVTYFPGPSEGGALGSVSKITFKGKVIFPVKTE